MKRIGMIAIALVMGSAFADIKTFPNGKFTGEGYWKDSKGKTGKYTVETLIKDNAIVEKLTFEEDKVVVSKSKVKFEKNGYFKVLDETNRTKGRGYCGSVWCHLRFRAEDLKGAEETIAFKENAIYRLGSARHEGTHFFWESKTVKVDE